MAQSSKDGIRSAILATKTLKRILVDIDGTAVELRQPNLKSLNDFAVTDDPKRAKIPAMVRMMIEYAYVPGTDDKVFTEADAEQLGELPTGPWMTKFTEAIGALTGIDVKEAEKN